MRCVWRVCQETVTPLKEPRIIAVYPYDSAEVLGAPQRTLEALQRVPLQMPRFCCLCRGFEEHWRYGVITPWRSNENPVQWCYAVRVALVYVRFVQVQV